MGWMSLLNEDGSEVGVVGDEVWDIMANALEVIRKLYRIKFARDPSDIELRSIFEFVVMIEDDAKADASDEVARMNDELTGEIELKKCPFCGGPGGRRDLGHTDKCYFNVDLAFPSDGLRRWNTRPIEDALRDEITQLRSTLGLQPIETAPCDGSQVLVAVKAEGGGINYYLCRWRNERYITGVSRHKMWIVDNTYGDEQGGEMDICEADILGWLRLPALGGE